MQVGMTPVSHIWEKAEPTAQPAWPQPRPFYLVGFGLGGLSFFSGTILLIIGFLGKYPPQGRQVAAAQ